MLHSAKSDRRDAYQQSCGSIHFTGNFTSHIADLRVQRRSADVLSVTGDGGFDLTWVEPAGEAADGTYVSVFAPDPHDIPQMAEFVRRYEAAYGDQFGPFAAGSALATRIALEAIQRCVEAGTLSRQCVRDELVNTDQKVGVLGFAVSFGAGNQLVGGRFSLYQVADGKFTLVIP